MDRVVESHKDFLALFDLFAALASRAAFVTEIMKQIDARYKQVNKWHYELNTENLLWNLYIDFFLDSTNTLSTSDLELLFIGQKGLKDTIEKYFKIKSHSYQSLTTKSAAIESSVTEFLQKVPNLYPYSSSIIKTILTHKDNDRQNLYEYEFYDANLDPFTVHVRQRRAELDKRLEQLGGFDVLVLRNPPAGHLLNPADLHKETVRFLNKLDSDTSRNAKIQQILENIWVQLIFNLLINAVALLQVNLVWRNLVVPNHSDELLVILKRLQAKTSRTEDAINEFWPIYQELYKDAFVSDTNKLDWRVALTLLQCQDKYNLKGLVASLGPIAKHLAHFLKPIKEEKQIINREDFKDIFEQFCAAFQQEAVLQSIHPIHPHATIYDLVKSAYLIMCHTLRPQIKPVAFFSIFEYQDSLHKLAQTMGRQRSELRRINSLYRKRQELLDENERETQRKTSRSGSLVTQFEQVRTGIEFEQFLKNLFETLGYRVETTSSSGDQGADLILVKESQRIVVQAKFYSSSVGNKAVQEVLGAIGYYKANKGIVITNSYYTSSAQELAEANNIRLIDGEKLTQMLESITAFDL